MIAHEIHHATRFGVQLNEPAIPIRAAVATVCEMLGYDPLYLACEGGVIAVVAPEQARDALAAWRKISQGCDASIIGAVTSKKRGVIIRTEIGGVRILDELEDDPLPRIG